MGFASIKVSAKGGADFTPVPAGVHLAICVSVIDLGIQKNVWQGQEKNKPQVYLGFELPEEQITYTKNGHEVTGPSKIGRTFTSSIGDKSNLGPLLESWRGKSFTDAERENFELTSVIGKMCQLGVIQETKNGKTYANITTALPLSKAQRAALEADRTLATPKNELTVYSPEAHDQVVFDRLPQWLQKKISERVQQNDVAAGDQSPSTATEDFNDSLENIPF
jgi:hypothetical protein